MRRREPAVRGSGDVPPAVLRIGTCTEVWAGDGGTPQFSAWRRHRAARRAWADEMA